MHICYIHYIYVIFTRTIIRIIYSYIYNHIYGILISCYIYYIFIKSNKILLLIKVYFLALLVFFILISLLIFKKDLYILNIFTYIYLYIYIYIYITTMAVWQHAGYGRAWAHWIVFMTSLICIMLFALCVLSTLCVMNQFVISVSINNIYIYIYNIYKNNIFFINIYINIYIYIYIYIYHNNSPCQKFILAKINSFCQYFYLHVKI